MSETAYIETSFVGYLTARSSKNSIVAANMEVTKDLGISSQCFHGLYLRTRFKRGKAGRCRDGRQAAGGTA